MVHAKDLLKSLGKTQEEQAKALGVDRSLISHILRGKFSLSKKVAGRLAQLTGHKAEIGEKEEWVFVRRRKVSA